MTWAKVTLEFEMDQEQVAAAQKRAAELDDMNLGGPPQPPESYTPSQAMARILASDENVTYPLCSRYTDGYTADPVEDA